MFIMFSSLFVNTSSKKA